MTSLQPRASRQTAVPYIMTVELDTGDTWDLEIQARSLAEAKDRALANGFHKGRAIKRITNWRVKRGTL